MWDLFLHHMQPFPTPLFHLAQGTETLEWEEKLPERVGNPKLRDMRCAGRWDRRLPPWHEYSNTGKPLGEKEAERR